MSKNTVDLEQPKGRMRVDDAQPGVMVAAYEAPFTHDDGYARITVGWEDDQYPDGRGCWIAQVNVQCGCFGCGDTPMEAMAELVRALTSGWSIWLKREDELHRAINNSPDALAKDLRDAEADLHKVQAYITSHVDGGADDWDEGLKPLWRAERALTAFAARIAATDSHA